MNHVSMKYLTVRSSYLGDYKGVNLISIYQALLTPTSMSYYSEHITVLNILRL